MLLGVDVGGTFTDAVLAREDRIVTAKAPTTPRDPTEGVLAAITTALRRAGVDAADVRSFSHGMTVATNALLEGTTARTALIVTPGRCYLPKSLRLGTHNLPGGRLARVANAPITNKFRGATNDALCCGYRLDGGEPLGAGRVRPSITIELWPVTRVIEVPRSWLEGSP